MENKVTDHPLTDKILHIAFDGFYIDSDYETSYFDADSMRAAYDKGHEEGVQVVKDYLKGKEVRIPGTLKITPKEEDL